jgi:CheY-like chemotaxis protein
MRIAEQLLERLKRDDGRRRRLFIDGIEGFRAASAYPERMPRFLSAFTNPELANVVESVILLRYVELRSQLHRLISIMKMRESKYDTSIREFAITDRGIEVSRSFESAESILTGPGVLQDEGYAVIECADGKQALEMLVLRRPDAALVDVMMPFMTGTELVAAARKDPRIDRVPIVLMSAVADPELKAGVAGFLKKPFALRRLLALLDVVVGRP